MAQTRHITCPDVTTYTTPTKSSSSGVEPVSDLRPFKHASAALSLSLQSCTLAISHNTQSYSMREGALKLCRPPLSLSMAKICLLRAFDYESASMTTTTALPCPWCVRAVRNKTQTIKSAKSEKVSTVPYQTLCMLHLRFAWVVL
jgi:hypothetical protein